MRPDSGRVVHAYIIRLIRPHPGILLIPKIRVNLYKCIQCDSN